MIYKLLKKTCCKSYIIYPTFEKTTETLKPSVFYYQLEPENSGIGSRPFLLDSSFDFQSPNEHETRQLHNVNRPISLNKWFNNLLVMLYSLQQHQMHFSIA